MGMNFRGQVCKKSIVQENDIFWSDTAPLKTLRCNPSGGRGGGRGRGNA